MRNRKPFYLVLHFNTIYYYKVLVCNPCRTYSDDFSNVDWGWATSVPFIDINTFKVYEVFVYNNGNLYLQQI